MEKLTALEIIASNILAGMLTSSYYDEITPAEMNLHCERAIDAAQFLITECLNQSKL